VILPSASLLLPSLFEFPQNLTNHLASYGWPGPPIGLGGRVGLQYELGRCETPETKLRTRFFPTQYGFDIPQVSHCRCEPQGAGVISGSSAQIPVSLHRSCSSTLALGLILCAVHPRLTDCSRSSLPERILLTVISFELASFLF
jgi:hypothetical protein